MIPQFHASDWYSITGRGDVAVVVDHGYDRPWELRGEQVMIDGSFYTVMGVETFAVMHGHRGRPIGLLVEDA